MSFLQIGGGRIRRSISPQAKTSEITAREGGVLAQVPFRHRLRNSEAPNRGPSSRNCRGVLRSLYLRSLHPEESGAEELGAEELGPVHSLLPSLSSGSPAYPSSPLSSASPCSA